jgi:putative FmdB family regulatory protein
MPIYEFRCRTCHKKTTALVLVRARVSEVRCQSCGGADLERLWSRFATVKSEDARMDALADPSALGGVDENDPKSMMQWMKRMGREMGEDLGDDFEAAMERELVAGGDGSPDQPGGADEDSTNPSSGGTDDL